MANKRQQRKPRGPAPAAAPPAEPAAAEPDGMKRGYARGRARDEAIRKSLKPLAPGERPTAVTVGAVVAGLFALANLLALILGWDAGPGGDDASGQAVAGSLLVAGVLCFLTYGMWRARYGAVLGMQTLLAITIIFCCIGLITATSVWALVLLTGMIAGFGALFWFLVKAMARLQMPERPGSTPRR